jgi:hypothetical protein
LRTGLVLINSCRRRASTPCAGERAAIKRLGRRGSAGDITRWFGLLKSLESSYRSDVEVALTASARRRCSFSPAPMNLAWSRAAERNIRLSVLPESNQPTGVPHVPQVLSRVAQSARTRRVEVELNAFALANRMHRRQRDLLRRASSNSLRSLSPPQPVIYPVRSLLD